MPPPADVPDFAVRVRVLGNGDAAPGADDRFTLTLTKAPEVTFRGAEWSPWVASTREGIEASLNEYSVRWELKTDASVVPAGKSFTRLTLDVETRIAGVESNRTPAELLSPHLGILLWRGDDGQTHIDTLAGHGRRVYDAAMRDAVLAPADRPRRIVFGERYIGGDDAALCWREGIQRLCGLGFNALHGVPAAFIPTVREAGITKLWGAVYNPPGYAFNFATNRPAIFRDFAAAQVAGALHDGWKREEIAFWVTSDEPGWYYPLTYTQFNEDPAAMSDFHAYLRERGLRPKDLGRPDWSAVRLTGRKDATDLPSRRLFYWSNRFLP
jgi:hypothetical protein